MKKPDAELKERTRLFKKVGPRIAREMSKGLQRLTGEDIRVEFANVQSFEQNKVSVDVGEKCFGSYVKFRSPADVLQGVVVVIFPLTSTRTLVELLLTRHPTELTEETRVDEMKLSAFKEAANIMALTYITGVANSLGVKLETAVPRFVSFRNIELIKPALLGAHSDLDSLLSVGQFVLQVSDDGAGLELEAIRNTGLERGLLPRGASQEEAMNSIFSGVTTTKRVTAVSGRGFGLNIVKKTIEPLGGAIKVVSGPKKGTTFTIEIPLTLAIIRALLVEVGGRIYAVPLANIQRLVAVGQQEIRGMLNYEAIVLNDEEIPITHLNVLFNTPSPSYQRHPVVIVKKGEQKMGLAVDTLLNTQEIVVKPLNRLVRESKYFAGSTIIGSGEVVLILDVANLILSERQMVNTA